MDSERIQTLVQRVNVYLDCKQQADLLWEQIEMHLQTSYLAESIGEMDLVPKHLRAVALLLPQANRAQEAVEQQLHSPVA